MTLKKYLKDRIIEIIIAAVSGLIILWLLIVFKVNLVVISLITGLFFMSWVIAFIYDYCRRKGFYNQMAENIEKLDKAYLVLETLETPDFLEGRLIMDMLYDIDKSMAKNVSLYQKESRDFSEYIEMWIHEVKLPLSAISLKLYNIINAEKEREDYSEEREDSSSRVMEYKKLLAETRRIEALINQVLYYVRSGNMEKDYHIAKVCVADIIHDVAMTYRENLQDNNIDFIVESGDIDMRSIEVNTDQKWFVFIMGQLIANSIKYRRDGISSFVKISATPEGISGDTSNYVIISVEDNGIGIPEQDIRRVFNKSFTGANGEGRTKSTGMGLYIVQELCKKLGHEVSIESEKGEWTRVNIKIMNNRFFDVGI